MTKVPDIEELIKSNPKIDREQLEDGLDLIRRLREEAASDPRTVRLGTKR
jgi:hypothetical protein